MSPWNVEQTKKHVFHDGTDQYWKKDLVADGAHFRSSPTQVKDDSSASHAKTGYIHLRNKVIYHHLTQYIWKSKKAREANIWQKREKAMSKKVQKNWNTFSVFVAHNATSKTRGAFLKFANWPVNVCKLTSAWLWINVQRERERERSTHTPGRVSYGDRPRASWTECRRKLLRAPRPVDRMPQVLVLGRGVSSAIQKGGTECPHYVFDNSFVDTTISRGYRSIPLGTLRGMSWPGRLGAHIWNNTCQVGC